MQVCLAPFERIPEKRIGQILSLMNAQRATSGIKVASLHEVSAAGKLWRSGTPIREQINLSLILAESTPVDVGEALELFPPEHYRFRFRPCMPTEHSGRNQLETISAVRFQKIQQRFAERGYYVGDEAIPTATEQAHSLASNVSRRRVMAELKIPFAKKLFRRMSL